MTKSEQTWLKRRRKGIGSSDAAVVMDQDPWRSKIALWAEKTGLAAPFNDTEPMRWGKLLESPIAREVAVRTGYKVANPGKRSIQQHPDYPELIATLDRLVEHPERGTGSLEIKNSGQWAEWADGVPLHYQIQVQHQLAVTGLPWAMLAVLLSGRELRLFPIERNERFIKALIRVEIEFWGYVERNEMPPIDGSESTRQALQIIYPEDNGQTALLPAEADEVARKLEIIKEKKKLLTDKERELENRLRAWIADNTFGRTPSGKRWSLRTIRKAAYAVEAQEYRMLRRIKDGDITDNGSSEA